MTGRLGVGAHSAAPTLAEHQRQFGPLPTVDGPRRGEPGGLADEVERAGLRGRGGGWFPTHLKLRAVTASAHSAGPLRRTRKPVVIANGMEGEPASGKDAALLASSPHLVFDGISLAARTVGATDAFIAIHRGSPLVDGLQAALDERTAAGVDAVGISLVTPPARYVASEESALSHWVGDGVATPVFPDRPFQRGAAGRPTLVQNVETLAHLALIARYGASWFASVGAPSAPGTTLVTVGGAVARPGVVEAPTGTSVHDLIAAAGGSSAPIRGYLTGGYGGAWVPADGFDAITWDPESVRDAGGVIGASVLWALEDGACPLEELARVTAWMAGESAGQCGPCMFGLPALSEDVRALAWRTTDEAGMKQLAERVRLVSGRGGCKHPDGTARFVATGIEAFPEEVALHLDGRCSIAGRRPAHAVGLPVPPTRIPALDTSGRHYS